MGAGAARPDIFQYDELTSFLQAWFASAPDVVSYRCLAGRIGISPGHCSNVVAGRRPLAPEVVADWARALRLGEAETTWLGLLSELQAARTARQRDDARSRLLAARHMREAARVDAARRRLMDSWLVIAVHELAQVPGYEPSPGWVCARLAVPVSAEEAREAIEVVATLQAALPDAVRTLVSTGFQAPRGPSLGLHAAVLGLAAQALERDPEEDREFQLYASAVSEATWVALRAEVRDAVARVIGRAERGSGAPTRVVQFACQLFTLARG